jgi:hypothetical protein
MATKNIDINSFFKPLLSFIRRFHITLFVVIVTGSLAGAILVLNSIQLEASTPPTDYTPQITNTTFDQETIDRIKQLSTAEEYNAAFSLPQGVRTNPFIE